jgi:hypothetical protein
MGSWGGHRQQSRTRIPLVPCQLVRLRPWPAAMQVYNTAECSQNRLYSQWSNVEWLVYIFTPVMTVCRSLSKKGACKDDCKLDSLMMKMMISYRTNKVGDGFLNIVDTCMRRTMYHQCAPSFSLIFNHWTAQHCLPNQSFQPFVALLRTWRVVHRS